MAVSTLGRTGPADGISGFLRDTDLCQLLDCNQDTIRRRIQRGEIPKPIVMGRRRYWPAAVIQKFLAGESTGNQNPSMAG